MRTIASTALAFLASRGMCAALLRAPPAPALVGFRTCASSVNVKPCSSRGSRFATPKTFSLRISPLSDGDGGEGSGGEAERLRETASRLRAEAQEAEKVLRESNPRSGTGAAAVETTVEPAEYSDLNDSFWEITYRFANEPEPKDDDSDESKSKPPRKFYGGRIRLHFRGDGYTDILQPSDSEESVKSSNAAAFRKVWGWDVENSEQDSPDYLLFSADISLPPPVSVEERFYFQARVDREEGDKDDGVISLRDGSVTVKRDIGAPTGGWWGVFRGADGILAQFRQVGEFRCRPVTDPGQ